MEDGMHRFHGYGHLHTRLWPTCSFAHVSSPDGSFRVRSCASHPVHWHMHLGARVQQLHLVCHPNSSLLPETLTPGRVPISTSFGRRPVFLLSQLINFGTSIWRAKANSYGSFMGACIVNGIGAGPAETIMPEIIADIFFLHDRGKWNTLYWVVYMVCAP